MLYCVAILLCMIVGWYVGFKEAYKIEKNLIGSIAMGGLFGGSIGFAVGMLFLQALIDTILK